MNRRTFIRTSLAASPLTCVQGALPAGRKPRILLRSSWQRKGDNRQINRGSPADPDHAHFEEHLTSVNLTTIITMKSTYPIIALFVLLLSNIGFGQQGTWNVRDFGAAGDGHTVDTVSIQKAIDACSEKGGGKVYIQGGTFRSGTLYLKDHVTLEIEAGTVLKASDNLKDFPSTPPINGKW